MDHAITPETEPADIPGERLRQMYRHMLTARQLDEDAIVLQRQGVYPAYAPMRGQEAAQVGSASALDPDRDFVFPTYRELGTAVAFGVDLVGYLASHLATWNGGLYDPIGSRFGSLNAVVGGPVLHAVGWAMGATLDDADGVALAYFGDGASSQGDVHEAMNFAAIYRLPVVFLCQNNGWAISVPAARQVAGGSVAARAAGYGMPGVRVDGNDPVAVYTATSAAVRRARAGAGPTVVEAMTYRLGPHSTSDDPGRYRSLAEEQDWIRRDPVPTFRARLLQVGLADEAFLARAEQDAAATTATVRAGVMALADRPGAELFAFVYRNPTAALRDQERQWREESSRA
ncbi:MAG TPA: thiamine pyrophosphate-dependent enzyme [Jiangellaceae bacterium]|nr:thiamine pyrophosphate-dependent enzyme [Jiangellaceae bacterium]